MLNTSWARVNEQMESTVDDVPAGEFTSNYAAVNAGDGRITDWC